MHTELFLRLNPACSLLGIPVATYVRRRHDGPQVSGDVRTRAVSMRQLESRHADLFSARRGRHAELLVHQAVKLWRGEARTSAVHSWGRAVRLHPVRAARRTASAVRDSPSARL